MILEWNSWGSSADLQTSTRAAEKALPVGQLGFEWAGRCTPGGTLLQLHNYAAAVRVCIVSYISVRPTESPLCADNEACGPC